MKRKYLDLVWLRGIGALKADAQDSYLGMLWWILEPLLLTALFYLAFSTGMKGSGSGDNFIFFLLCGMLPFKWTASTLTSSSQTLLNNLGIMGQVFLPKWIFPAATNLSMAIRFAFILPVMMLFMIYGGYEPNINWLTIGYVLLCQLIFNIGISFLVSATVPLVPDLTHIVPLVVTALLFTSGIFFDINERPEDIQAILRLNPFVEILDGYRAVLIHGEAISPSDMLYAWYVSISTFAIGLGLLTAFNRYYPRALT
jgi:lipopolysaccharide transport system permease protein